LAVPQVVQTDAPAVTRGVVTVGVSAFRATRDGHRVIGRVRAVGDQTIGAETRRVRAAEIVRVVAPVGDLGPIVTRRGVYAGVGPATVPSRAHVARIVVHAVVLVAGIDLAAPADLVEVDGVADLLELVLVVDAGAVAPLLLGHQQGESHVLVGVLRAVRADAVSIRVDLPIHQVTTGGVGHPLHGVLVHAVEGHFVGHQGGDQHAIADTFRHGIVAVLGALDTVTTRAVGVTRAGDTAVGDELGAPVAIKGLHPGVGDVRAGRSEPIVIQERGKVGVGIVREREGRASRIDGRRISVRPHGSQRRQEE